jgi:hypothetical protein
MEQGGGLNGAEDRLPCSIRALLTMVLPW